MYHNHPWYRIKVSICLVLCSLSSFRTRGSCQLVVVVHISYWPRRIPLFLVHIMHSLYRFVFSSLIRLRIFLWTFLFAVYMCTRFFKSLMGYHKKKTFEDIKGIIRSIKSKTERQKNKDKRTNNNLQSTTLKTKDPESHTSLRPMMCYVRVSSSCTTCIIRQVK